MYSLCVMDAVHCAVQALPRMGVSQWSQWCGLNVPNSQDSVDSSVIQAESQEHSRLDAVQASQVELCSVEMHNPLLIQTPPLDFPSIGAMPPKYQSRQEFMTTI